MLGGFVAFSGLAAYQFVVSDRDKRRIRESFSHYVAPAVLSEIERLANGIEVIGLHRVDGELIAPESFMEAVR